MNAVTSSHQVDVAGVGINATDTIIRLPRFPALDSKVELISNAVMPGGQVASAIVACQRWGLKTRYTGKIGDDAAGQLQRDEMMREGVDANWITAPGCSSQIAYILVDEISGERTVLWKRDPKIALRPEELKHEWISGSRTLLVDGHDTEAAAQAARWARAENIPVVGDFDNRYAGVEGLLEQVNFPITSRDFPERMTGQSNLLISLPLLFSKFKFHLIAATIGRLGVLAWDGTRFILCPGFRVKTTDTTGAGDIFHGAFLHGLLQGWPIEQALEFSCAAAALNCEAMGARGGIATLEQIEYLRRNGQRSEMAFADQEMEQAARASKIGRAKIIDRNPAPMRGQN